MNGRCAQTLALLLVLVPSIIPEAKAQGTTFPPFQPDIVMTCRDQTANGSTYNCEISCYSLSAPAPTPTQGVSRNPQPGWVYRFKQLGFFSKAGHESEHWLIAIDGAEGGVSLPPNKPPTPGPIPQPNPSEKLYVTLGRDVECTYEGKYGSKVELTRYYGETAATSP